VTGDALVVQGDALNLPLPDESVDLIITSPPYFALRSYQDAGTHYKGQIGSEPSPKEFLEVLWAATREMVRVLKPTGSLFVNLGDKYAGTGGPNGNTGILGGKWTPEDEERWGPRNNTKQTSGFVKAKSLMMLPARYAIGCIDDLGLILRAEIIWNKPNGLPESVQDRVRRSHEQWFHFVRSPRYFAAVDEVREPHSPSSEGRYAYAFTTQSNHQSGNLYANNSPEPNPLGKLPGSVWTIPSEPLIVPEWARKKLNLPDHFAAFPQEFPRRIILGWSPSGVCVECGEGRRPVVAKQAQGRERTDHGAGAKYTENGFQFESPGRRAPFERTPWAEGVMATITGYACACTPYRDHPGTGEQDRTIVKTPDGQPARQSRGDVGGNPRTGPHREYHLDSWTPPDTRPAVVCDPFGGTGTTAMVARALGRIGVSVDLSHDYSRLAKWRVTSNHAAKSISRTNLERQMTL
jgi:DNA modification methylase